MQFTKKVNIYLNSKGLSFYSLKNYDLAVKAFDQALKIDNKSVDSYYNKGD